MQKVLKTKGHFFTFGVANDPDPPYLLIASYGNIVTAIPEEQRTDPQKNWRGDLQLLVDYDLIYARWWHILDGPEWPWLKLGTKWDLTQRNLTYISQASDVIEATRDAGKILEWHAFDRGCGGAQDSYKNYPWYPKNNPHGLDLPLDGTGTPAFYEPSQPLRHLQEQYVTWLMELINIHGVPDPRGPMFGVSSHVVLEIENEHRDNPSGSLEWVKRWSEFIKGRNPAQLISYSTLEPDWERAWRFTDQTNIHMGRECRDDPECIRRLLQKCWGFAEKPCVVDEWANGEGNRDRLLRTTWVIVTAGGHSKIEDARPSSNPLSVFDQAARAAFREAALGASTSVNHFVKESGWKFWEAAPKGYCMESPRESVCQSYGREIPIRPGDLRFYDPRTGAFTLWEAHEGGVKAPPDGQDWVVQARH